ncbi:LacI family transcriptional regulator [Intrasporangium chromatireducens Q5-1]|uniref:LacI family transcriptional regulator n=1 Tax=Intrasporangium chromatireducens Q5-1 TaxID=584657 RepID=W9GCV5_9MICO|nr:LacI family DNA-binding transcriptional regulator [Intrasporangium chromatireducens]EWT03915.1 LacI family transcriptional regulator [Intrasporangium chromatireducens Q5-1]
MTKAVQNATPPRAVTMADVAARAGVSVATVSRVISQSRPVAKSLREAVLGAASDLGYQVNLVGRALRKGRTATVGLLVPDLDNPFFSSVAQHLSTAFEGSATDVLIFSTCGDVDVERRGVESFLGRQVDAVVMIPCHEVESAASVQRAAQATLTIQLDRQVVDADVHFVGCDNDAGMSLITRHIEEHVDTEVQPVLYVGAQAGSSSGHERFKHFHEDFPDRPSYLGEFDFGWGQEAVDLLLEDGYTKATIVAAADIIALGIIARLHARGHRVPDDFRVIGFDGVGVARFAHPTLTTVRQPVEEIGRTVLDLISAEHTQPSQALRIVPDFVPGHSSPD